MGKVMSTMTRPVKKFNIENRAHRIISQDKPTQAPMYESSKKQLEVAQNVNPTFMESHNKKDPGLDDRLKNIYIRSYDPLAAEIKDHPDKPLPLLTKSGEEFEYGYWEPREAREGKCMLRTALQFMADHTNDPVNHTPKKIAETYKLDVKDVEKVLEHFRVFKIIVPDGKVHLAHVERKTLDVPKQD